jgi:hypothetical protein
VLLLILNSCLDCRDNWVENILRFEKSLSKALAFTPIITIKGHLRNSHIRVVLNVDEGLAVKNWAAMLIEWIPMIIMLLSHL